MVLNRQRLELKMERVRNIIIAVIYECCDPQHCSIILNSSAFRDAVELAYGDLLAYVQKDPAMNFDPGLIIMNSTSYTAVLHYRIANAIYSNKNLLYPKISAIYAVIFHKEESSNKERKFTLKHKLT